MVSARAPLSSSEVLARDLLWTAREVERLEVEERDCQKLQSETRRLKRRLRQAKESRQWREEKLQEQIAQKKASIDKYEVELKQLQKACSEVPKRLPMPTTTPTLEVVPSEVQRLFGSESWKRLDIQPSIEDVGHFHWAAAELEAADCYHRSSGSTSMPTVRHADTDTPELKALKLEWLPKNLATKAKQLTLASLEMEDTRSHEKAQFDQKLHHAHQQFLRKQKDWETMQQALFVEQLVSQVLVTKVSELLDAVKVSLPRKMERSGDTHHESEHSKKARAFLQPQIENAKKLAASAEDLLKEVGMGDSCQWTSIMRRLRYETNIMRSRSEEFRVALAAKQVRMEQQKPSQPPAALFAASANSSESCQKSSSSRLQKLERELESTLGSLRTSIRKAAGVLGTTAMSATLHRHLSCSLHDISAISSATFYGDARPLKSEVDDLYRALLEVRGTQVNLAPEPAIQKTSDEVDAKEHTQRESQLPDYYRLGAEAYLIKRLPKWLEVAEKRQLAASVSKVRSAVNGMMGSCLRSANDRVAAEVTRRSAARDGAKARQAHRATLQQKPAYSDQATQIGVLEQVDQATQLGAPRVDQETQMVRPRPIHKATQVATQRQLDQATQMEITAIDQATQVDISEAITNVNACTETLLKFIVDSSAFAAIERVCEEKGFEASHILADKALQPQAVTPRAMEEAALSANREAATRLLQELWLRVLLKQAEEKPDKESSSRFLRELFLKVVLKQAEEKGVVPPDQKSAARLLRELFLRVLLKQAEDKGAVSPDWKSAAPFLRKLFLKILRKQGAERESVTPSDHSATPFLRELFLRVLRKQAVEKGTVPPHKESATRFLSEIYLKVSPMVQAASERLS